MDNDKKIQKVLLRKNLICYFLAMAKGQEAIQQLQQELVLHPYFNPILIFKKVSKGHMVLTQSNYKQYMMTKVGITSQSEMEAYLRKHELEYTIECEQFIATMLPYTPDTLRNSQATIVWQVKSSPSLKKDIEQLFKQILRVQIYHILNVASFRKKITANWQEIKAMIKKDFKNNGTFIENRHVDSEIDMMRVRRWMQLWIQIKEKDVLDMIRWMGGEFEDSIRKYFNKITLLNVATCTCDKSPDYQIRLKQSVKRDDSVPLRSLSMRPLSRKELQMYQRKISYLQQQISPKASINKPLLNSSRSMKSPQRKPSIAERLFKDSEGQRKKLDQKSISLWCQYIYSLLSGQKILTEKRISLKPNLDKAISILQNVVISKKREVTKITKIISFIEKYIELPLSSKKHLEKYLSNLSMANDVIISIFNTGLIQKSIPTNEPQNMAIEQKKLKLLKIQIAQILQNYCLTKSRLIQISKQLIRHNLHHNLYKILNPTNSKIITKQTLTQILKEMQMNFSQQDLQILMKHFGDGENISEDSFFRVFYIQDN